MGISGYSVPPKTSDGKTQQPFALRCDFWIKLVPSWWLNRPHLKIGKLPQVGVKIKHIWNHHVVIPTKIKWEWSETLKPLVKAALSWVNPAQNLTSIAKYQRWWMAYIILYLVLSNVNMYWGYWKPFCEILIEFPKIRSHKYKWNPWTD